MENTDKMNKLPAKVPSISWQRHDDDSYTSADGRFILLLHSSPAARSWRKMRKLANSHAPENWYMLIDQDAMDADERVSQAGCANIYCNTYSGSHDGGLRECQAYARYLLHTGRDAEQMYQRDLAQDRVNGAGEAVRELRPILQDAKDQASKTDDASKITDTAWLLKMTSWTIRSAEKVGKGAVAQEALNGRLANYLTEQSDENRAQVMEALNLVNVWVISEAAPQLAGATAALERAKAELEAITPMDWYTWREWQRELREQRREEVAA